VGQITGNGYMIGPGFRQVLLQRREDAVVMLGS
jgi:hypothetical protein